MPQCESPKETYQHDSVDSASSNVGSSRNLDSLFVRVKPNWQPPAFPTALPCLEMGRPRSIDQIEHIEFSWAGETLRIAGIAIHKLFEPIGQTDWAIWKTRSVTDWAQMAYPVLQENGLTGKQLELAKNYVLEVIHMVQNDSKADWLFSNEHHSIQCEWRLSAWFDNQVKNIVIDRSFVDENNIRWIVDFKTSRHEGSDLPAFLQQEKNRYFTQLMQYAKIVSLKDTRKIRLGLYFPLIQQWIEWQHLDK